MFGDLGLKVFTSGSLYSIPGAWYGSHMGLFTDCLSRNEAGIT